jgi:general secretion pathway protein J
VSIAGPTRHSAGFTLIELLISLALFALISLAGFKLIEAIAGVAERTGGRTERLAEIERALFLITADFEQSTQAPVAGSGRVALVRASATGDYPVEYFLAGSAIHRVAGGADRAVLTGVSTLGWRYFRDGAWRDQPADPVPPQSQPGAAAPEPPRAVEVSLALAGNLVGLSGPVRRVFALPVQP